MNNELVYKVIGNNNFQSENDIFNEILINRKVNPDVFNVTEDDLPHWKEFRNMGRVCGRIETHLKKGSKIIIILDSDPDGVTSACPLYLYLIRLFPDADIEIVFHEKRTHGILLGELNGKLKDTDLIITPDSGSDNYYEHKILKQRFGIDVVCIDHHPVKRYSVNAIVTNNNIDKKCTALSGAGMVYILMRAFDERYKVDYADDYIDLVAIGIIADMMPINNKYIQYIIQKGLNNIKNKAVLAIIEAQSFNLGSMITPTAVSFNISPLINSVFRMGTIKEKENLVRAFCEKDNGEVFIYIPSRGKNKGASIKETLYQKTARELISLNEKRKRQGKKCLKEAMFKKEGNILFVEIKSEYGEKGLSRIACNGMAREHMKPAIVFYKGKSGSYGGSMTSGDTISSFRDKLRKTGVFTFVAGHQDASGFALKRGMNKKGKTILEEYFKNEKIEKRTVVDFSLDLNEAIEFHEQLIEQVVENELYYGKRVEAPKVHLRKIKIPVKDVKLAGESTIKIKICKKFSLVLFKQSKEIYEEMVGWKEFIEIDVIGSVGVNIYRGRNYQMIVNEIYLYKNENINSDDQNESKEDFGLDDEW